MSVKCGNCKGHHEGAPQVKVCYGQPAYRQEIGQDMLTGKPVTYVTRKDERLQDGFYTVVMSDEPGDHTTIRLRTQDKDARFAPGEQVASYLMGPDNESDYQGFAFVKADRDFNVWRRFRSSHNLINALGVLTQDPEEAGQAYALRSGRCRRCNRTLTVPASINRGFGPDCAQMVGVA